MGDVVLLLVLLFLLFVYWAVFNKRRVWVDNINFVMIKSFRRWLKPFEVRRILWNRLVNLIISWLMMATATMAAWWFSIISISHMIKCYCILSSRTHLGYAVNGNNCMASIGLLDYLTSTVNSESLLQTHERTSAQAFWMIHSGCVIQLNFLHFPYVCFLFGFRSRSFALIRIAINRQA